MCRFFFIASSARNCCCLTFIFSLLTEVICPRSVVDPFIHILIELRDHSFKRGYYNLMLCYVMLPHFLSKISSDRARYMSKILWIIMLSVMLPYDFFIKESKILCSVMLCLWWHELKSKILWSVMLVLFVSKILWSLMKLTIFTKNYLSLWAKVLVWVLAKRTQFFA